MATKAVEKIERDIATKESELANAEQSLSDARASLTEASNHKLAIAAQCHIGKAKVSKLDTARRAEDMAQGAVSIAQQQVEGCNQNIEKLQGELSDAQTAVELAAVKATLAAHKECGEQLIESWRQFVTAVAAWRNFNHGAIDEYRKSVGRYTPVGIANETSFTVCALIAPILQQFPAMDFKYVNSIIQNHVLASPDSPDDMLQQIVAIRSERVAAVLNSIDRPTNGKVRRWSDDAIKKLRRFRPRKRKY